MSQVYGGIAEELHSQYILQYVPENHDAEGFRAITLATKSKSLTVQIPSGYYKGE